VKRNNIENKILARLDELDPSKTNSKIYSDLFKRMSDMEFDVMMNNIKNGTYGISIFAPNSDKNVRLDLDRNKSTMRKRGIRLFKKLNIQNGDDSYMPNNEFMVLAMPIAMMSQTISKNFSVHDSLKSRNALTGQVTGDSKSGEITLNEINILKSLGLKSTLNEFVGVRGGDISASNMLKTQLFNNGAVDATTLAPFITKTGATTTLKQVFKAIHIDINI